MTGLNPARSGYCTCNGISGKSSGEAAESWLNSIFSSGSVLDEGSSCSESSPPDRCSTVVGSAVLEESSSISALSFCSSPWLSISIGAIDKFNGVVRSGDGERLKGIAGLAQLKQK